MAILPCHGSVRISSSFSIFDEHSILHLLIFLPIQQLLLLLLQRLPTHHNAYTHVIHMVLRVIIVFLSMGCFVSGVCIPRRWQRPSYSVCHSSDRFACKWTLDARKSVAEAICAVDIQYLSYPVAKPNKFERGMGRSST
jgi:hypothetical protein